MSTLNAHTSHSTGKPAEQTAAVDTSAQPTREKSRGHLGALGTFRRRVLTLLLVAASAVGLSFMLAQPASAIALSSNQNFYALCSQNGVTAFAPDMTWYPNNAVVWQPTLQIYTDSGWLSYQQAQNPQVALGQNMRTNPWDFTGTWVQSSFTFGSVARGHYYRVRYTYGWAGAGAGNTVYTNAKMVHALAQNNTNLTVAKYSLSGIDGYCYVP